MKLEVGKYYKTRAGRKAIIYNTGCGGDFPVHGAIECDKGLQPEEWASNGSYDTSGPTTFDLVEEWSEPKPKLVAWLVTLPNEATYPRFFKEGFTPPSEEGCTWERAPWLDEVRA